MTAVIIFCGLSALLVLGKVLRVAVPLLQRLYLPSSVIGGILGLILVNCYRGLIPPEWIALTGRFPGFLINVVFAALFLGTVTPALKQIWHLALPQLCFGQLLAWGQYVLGLGLVALVLLPVFGVNPAFGNLLEIGFEGGHGTVGGMAKTFDSYHWSDGIALGYTVATCGMLFGVVIGMALVNWAFRRNHVSELRLYKDQGRLERLGIHDPAHQPSAGRQTVFCDSIDSLAWHIALIGIAILIGLGIQQGLLGCEKWLRPEVEPHRLLFAGFPLFPLCMIGGLLLQKVAERCRVHKLIDNGQMQRLSGAALDFLVVSAVATIQLSVVAANWLPLTILIVCGVVWSVGMVIFVAPRVFQEAWFERAIAEFGQSLGVTATGLLLLRTVDPESKTVAAQAFGYKQLLHEPIMGGGLWTALALTLVFVHGYRMVWLISIGVFVFWVLVAFWLARRNRTHQV